MEGVEGVHRKHGHSENQEHCVSSGAKANMEDDGNIRMI